MQVGILRVVLDGVDYVVGVLRLHDRAQHVVAADQLLRGRLSVEACLVVGVALRCLVECDQELRLGEVDGACLLIQLNNVVGAFCVASVFRQADRSGRALRVEAPDVVLVVNQQLLVVGGPARCPVGAGIVGHIVQDVPSDECLRRGQLIKRTLGQGACVPAAVGLAIPVGILAGRRDAVASVVGGGETCACAGLYIHGVVVAACAAFPHRGERVGGGG